MKLHDICTVGAHDADADMQRYWTSLTCCTATRSCCSATAAATSTSSRYRCQLAEALHKVYSCSVSCHASVVLSGDLPDSITASKHPLHPWPT